jgi:arylsulfatase
MLTIFGDAASVTDFEADQWELYHLDEDWNEVNDLADAEPERLAELIAQWWVEAEKYGALPLGAVINGMNGPPILRKPRR